jgi:hypothetical protein
MAIYKIFPEKDATLYSDYPSTNTGLDEILEIGNIENFLSNSPAVRRALVKFGTTDIQNVINTLFDENSRVNQTYSASLKLYLADATSIPLEYNVEAYPISSSYNMGIGKFGDSPINTSGVSWKFTNSSASGNEWGISDFSLYTTASYSTVSGGGTWYYEYPSYNVATTQSFNYNNTKDINIDVTDTVKLFYNDTLVNEGFILKLPNSIENSTDYFNLKYFSMDTHTIYPPCLELKWDDSVFNTGSQSIINQTPFQITLQQNQFKYDQNAVQKFRFNVRPQYPQRQFITSSVYTLNYYLPENSYYQVRDQKTDEVIIDFDTTFTKISADGTSSYFNLFMNGLQPERYYNIYIKTTIDGSTLILNQNLDFKIVL